MSIVTFWSTRTFPKPAVFAVFHRLQEVFTNLNANLKIITVLDHHSTKFVHATMYNSVRWVSLHSYVSLDGSDL